MRYFGEIAHRFRVIAHLFPRNSASRLRLDALLPPSRSAISGSRARACARDTAGMRATMHMHACMHCAFAHACRRHTGVAGVVALSSLQLLAPRPSICIVADGGAWGDAPWRRFKCMYVFTTSAGHSEQVCAATGTGRAPLQPLQPLRPRLYRGTRADTCMQPLDTPLVPRVHNPLYQVSWRTASAVPQRPAYATTAPGRGSRAEWTHACR